MDNLQITKDIGISIINELHQYNEKYAMDDAEYIPIIKTIIKGISAQLISHGYSKLEVDENEKVLKQYCKELYTQACIKHTAPDEEEIESEKQQNEEYFDHIYKHEEHPY